jgi:hypothetical protein
MILASWPCRKNCSVSLSRHRVRAYAPMLSGLGNPGRGRFHHSSRHRRLGVKYPSTVHGWHRRDIGFPEPVVVLSSGMVCAWPDVEKSAKATGGP